MIELFEYLEKSLPDERLRRRANAVLERLTERPGLPFTGMYKKRKDRQAAYRLVENDRLTFDIMLDPLADQLAKALREGEARTALVVHDTTELDFSNLVKSEGFGTIGNPDCRGEFLHTALAVSTEGVLAGVLCARTWIRDPAERGKSKTRRERAPEEKESIRWWETIEKAEQRVAKPGLLLHVADREGDIYDLFGRAGASGYRLLIRAAQDRVVDGEAHKLWATCESWSPQLETHVVQVPARPATKKKPAEPAREARLTIRFGRLDLLAPQKRGNGEGRVGMYAVLVREETPPEGVTPVEWLLLITDEVKSFADAWRYVEYYRCRWVIEEFHLTLKSGCNVEEREYEERAHLDVALPLYMTVAARIVRLKKLARIRPELPALVEFKANELTVLCEGDEQEGAALSLLGAVLKVGELGGFSSTRKRPYPGWLTLWRGLFLLTAQVEGFEFKLRPKRRRAGP